MNTLNIEKLAKVTSLTKNQILMGTLFHTINRFSINDDLEKARFLTGMVRDHLCYCPDCLSEKPFHRLIWRIKDIDVCLRHHYVLLDKCLSCNHCHLTQKSIINKT